jgi:solute carrier family 50 protein (sugar transporter)
MIMMMYSMPLPLPLYVQPRVAAIVAVVVFGWLISNIAAQESELETITTSHTAGANDMSLSLWSSVVNLCEIIAPYCGVVCFLAPLPTMKQISRDKTVGKLPLLPYSSMVANSFVWVMYGLMKNIPSVWGSNAIGVMLGAYYFAVFTRHCGPMATKLPGTVLQHLMAVGGFVALNVLIAASGVSNASDLIGKEGVIMCIVLFASPLAALRHVIVTKSASSIPLPFILACLLNCSAWFVLGWWRMNDFNIYFPNMLGLGCAVAQILLKCVYGNRTTTGAYEETMQMRSLLPK